MLGRWLALALCAAFAPPATADLPICVREDAAPFSERGDDGTFRGYSVDLCKLVAKQMGETVTFVPVTVETRFDVLLAGTCDMLCGATTVTMRRRETLGFSLITFVTDTAFLFPRTLLKGIAPNRKSLSVGYLSNTTAHEYLMDDDLFTMRRIHVELQDMDSHEAAAAALAAGEIDSYIADREILQNMLQDMPELAESHIIGTRGLTYEPYAIAMAKDNLALRERVDQALAQLFRDSVIWTLVEQYIPSRSNDALLASLLKIQSIPE
ncbi:transporter substrate-binding domain-containing protein [Marivita sp. S2033]|uniref:transporter substrate-binding domain-containing protein n=1 Tax=Marivita sp. S2033 TaxID=3373187 RepID=UPI003982A07E